MAPQVARIAGPFGIEVAYKKEDWRFCWCFSRSPMGKIHADGG
jgi:hypothetical protein